MPIKLLIGALKSQAGSLWAWGSNTNGELGDGTIVHKSSPVQVGAMTTWATVAGGSNHSVAIKTDGTLWAWGGNAQGQLGDGTIVSKSSPVQVGALTTWSKISIATGANFTLAVKTDGTLWAWGLNNFGELGDGTIVKKSSPVQVGALTTWSKIGCGDNHAMAIKTDGTLWTWGRSQSGQLGSGAITSRSSPVQVGALTTWNAAAGGSDHSVATKTDGTIWAWGSGTAGELGDGTNVSKSSPVQVGALTTWSSTGFVCGAGFTITVKTNNTMWSWGANTNGQLGDGTIVHKSSPVQIGALTNWGAVGRVQSTGLAVKV